MKNTIDDATPEEWAEAAKANHAVSVERARERERMQGVAAVATGSAINEPVMPQIPPHICRRMLVLRRKRWVMKQLERLPFFRA